MTQKYIGLMSGTSLDAMDAVLVAFSSEKTNIISNHTKLISSNLRQQILSLSSNSHIEIKKLAIVDKRIAELAALTIQELLKQSGEQASNIHAIGSHGQTIRHIPEMAYTLQIGDPNLISELTGITVVADFRRRDMAAGGQGAPLVPAFHKAVFSSNKESRVIVNIGGISNITILPANSTIPVTGFDTGPGNMLMDYWCEKHKGTPFDYDGKWAASSYYSQILLDIMMTEPFFKQAPPKSTGRELFNSEWLTKHIKHHQELTPEIIQATICQLTVKGITTAIQKYAPDTQAVFVCGGGSKNKTLMNILETELENITLNSSKKLGFDPDLVEAASFAWLAKQTMQNSPGNLPEVTGAKGFRVLGGIFPK